MNKIIGMGAYTVTKNTTCLALLWFNYHTLHSSIVGPVCIVSQTSNFVTPNVMVCRYYKWIWFPTITAGVCLAPWKPPTTTCGQAFRVQIFQIALCPTLKTPFCNTWNMSFRQNKGTRTFLGVKMVQWKTRFTRNTGLVNHLHRIITLPLLYIDGLTNNVTFIQSRYLCNIVLNNVYNSKKWF